MTLEILNVEQGTPEWHDARRGLVTASAVGKLLTPTLKVANNDTSRAITHQLVAERLTGNTDPTYPSRDMERGTFDEPAARAVYNDEIAPVVECGFMVITTDTGHRIGYSPDGLVGTEGLIEIKSRLQKAQLETILTNQIPPENMAQLQCGLLVTGRAWIDYVSYCSGMPLWTKRVLPDPDWHTAILEAVDTFEERARLITEDYAKKTAGLPETIRIPELEEMRL